MRFALFALTLLAPNVPTQPAPPPQTPESTLRTPAPPESHARPLCKYVNRIPAVLRDAPVRSHALGQEPRANLYLSVLHYENGCEKPVMIRFDAEGSGRQR